MDHIRLIAVLPHLGRVGGARAEIPTALKLRPDISVHEYDRHMKTTGRSAQARGNPRGGEREPRAASRGRDTQQAALTTKSVRR